jgi:hypothetical protein
MVMRNKVEWFNDVGIVLVELEYPPFRKYYIKKVDGFNKELDIQAIKNWGNSFPKDAGDVLFRFSTVSQPTE